MIRINLAIPNFLFNFIVQLIKIIIDIFCFDLFRNAKKRKLVGFIIKSVVVLILLLYYYCLLLVFVFGKFNIIYFKVICCKKVALCV